MEKNPQQVKEREAGMMICAGIQGVGKTYQNMHVIADYIKDKLYNRVPGRKCLIMDTNGEYTAEQFAKNDIPNFSPKKIALSQVAAWGKADIAECRRIDAKEVGMKEKKEILEYLLKVYRNGMLVIEDINTYILNVTHMEEIVGGLVNLRHRAVDVLVSYQSLRPVEPRMWQNARWIKMFHQQDNVSDIMGKVAKPALMKIAQLIVDEKYDNGNERFYVIIHNFKNKIEGDFTQKEFINATRQYLSITNKAVTEHMKMYNKKRDEALAELSIKYLKQYYGN
jgi:hypothetical protein